MLHFTERIQSLGASAKKRIHTTVTRLQNCHPLVMLASFCGSRLGPLVQLCSCATSYIRKERIRLFHVYFPVSTCQHFEGQAEETSSCMADPGSPIKKTERGE